MKVNKNRINNNSSCLLLEDAHSVASPAPATLSEPLWGLVRLILQPNFIGRILWVPRNCIQAAQQVNDKIRIPVQTPRTPKPGLCWGRVKTKHEFLHQTGPGSTVDKLWRNDLKLMAFMCFTFSSGKRETERWLNETTLHRHYGTVSG